MIWLAAVIQVLQPGPAVVESAEIEIGIEASAAVVRASYAVSGVSDSLVMRAMMIPGQRVDIVSVSRPWVVDSVPGMIRISVTPSQEEVINVEYRVTGAPSRIPIWVPDPATDPLSSRVQIAVVDPPSDLRAADLFPRFDFSDERTGVAVLANVPSLVRLPRVGEGVSVNRTADAAVVILLILASVWWAVRARHGRQAHKATLQT